MITPSVVSMAERMARTEFRRLLAILILVVKRQPVQGENVERSLGRKRVLEAAKHRGAIGSPAQAAGEAEKAELGQAQFQMAWILRHDEHHPTSVSSSKFEFTIRLKGSSVAGAISPLGQSPPGCFQPSRPPCPQAHSRSFLPSSARLVC